MATKPSNVKAVAMQRRAGVLTKAAAYNESLGDKRGGKILRKRAKKLVDQSLSK